MMGSLAERPAFTTSDSIFRRQGSLGFNLELLGGLDLSAGLGSKYKSGCAREIEVTTLTRMRDRDVQLQTRAFQHHLKNWNQQTTKPMYDRKSSSSRPVSDRCARVCESPVENSGRQVRPHNMFGSSQAGSRHQGFRKQLALQHLQLSSGR